MAEWGAWHTAVTSLYNKEMGQEGPWEVPRMAGGHLCLEGDKQEGASDPQPLAAPL